MASDLGLLEPVRVETSKFLGRFIELSRREKRWSLEKLAAMAKVELSDVWSLEHENGPHTARTVVQVANALGLPAEKLLELAGLVESRDKTKLSQAAIRFAAHSETTAELSRDEREALNEFMKVLV